MLLRHPARGALFSSGRGGLRAHRRLLGRGSFTRRQAFLERFHHVIADVVRIFGQRTIHPGHAVKRGENHLSFDLHVAGFGGGYALITWVSRRRLDLNSQHIADEQTHLVKALQEGLGGIRDVLLDGTQPVYCDIYDRANRSLTLMSAKFV